MVLMNSIEKGLVIKIRTLAERLASVLFVSSEVDERERARKREN